MGARLQHEFYCENAVCSLRYSRSAAKAVQIWSPVGPNAVISSVRLCKLRACGAIVMITVLREGVARSALLMNACFFTGSCSVCW